MPARELTALVLIALTPVAIVATIMTTVHVFTDRYILWSALGIALLSALALRLFARRNPVRCDFGSPPNYMNSCPRDFPRPQLVEATRGQWCHAR